MLHLKKKDTTPPGGFTYVDADTDFPFKANCLQDLLKKVSDHRIANKLAIPADLKDRIEDWICRRMPTGVCDSETGGMKATGNHRALTESIMNATMRIFRGTRLANQSTANERAIICSTCIRNIRTPGCNSCRGVNSIIKGMIGRNSTPFDAKLNTCDYSGTALRVLVHCGTVKLASKLTESERPKQCWL